MSNRPFQRQEGAGPSQRPSNRLGCSNWSSLIWLLLLGSVALWIWFMWGSGAGSATSISYTAFRQQLRDGNVEQVTIEGEQIQGALKESATKEVPEGENVDYTQFVTYLPSFGDDELMGLLEEQNVTIETRPESNVSWLAILLNYLPILLLLGAGFYLFSRMRSGGGGISSVFSMRESGAKLYDRSEILKIHSRDKPLADDVDLERVARGTPGFSGADLENLLNGAALLAARRDREQVQNTDVEEARDKVMMGLEREGISLAEDELEMLAYHEGGHAIVAAVLPHADPIHKVTIVPRGQAMGVTQQLTERDRYIYRSEYMLDRLAVMMGRRAAEHMVLGTATSGAENDLKQATQLARRMVLDWGMSERLGHMAYGGRSDQVFLGQEIAQRREYSETTAREIDEEIKDILSQAYQRAQDTLKEHREHLDKLVDALVAKEEIAGEAVVALVEGDPSQLFGNNGQPEEENKEKLQVPATADAS